jgi:hypothetical protein
MHRFESFGQAQRFLTVHSQVRNIFRVGRQLLRAVNYRQPRNRSYEMWQQVKCAYKRASIFQATDNLRKAFSAVRVIFL